MVLELTRMGQTVARIVPATKEFLAWVRQCGFGSAYSHFTTTCAQDGAAGKTDARFSHEYAADGQHRTANYPYLITVYLRRLSVSNRSNASALAPGRYYKQVDNRWHSCYSLPHRFGHVQCDESGHWQGCRVCVYYR